jgi:hypothetical protein
MKIGRERESHRFETDDGLWEPFLKRICKDGMLGTEAQTDRHAWTSLE